MPKIIVISAIALRTGGTLSILQDCVREIVKPAYATNTIYLLVKEKSIITDVGPNIHVMEIDGSSSYFNRWYYEYYYFKDLSASLKPNLWISLHDITPDVTAEKQVVYCHNPSSFYRISLKEFLLDPKFGMFTIFYSWLYKINVKRNAFVIVQQQWIRKEFSRKFGVNEKKIIVSHPNTIYTDDRRVENTSGVFTFFYPTFPRVFKNIEIIGEALRVLQEKKITGFEVIVTIDGQENAYSWWLKKKFSDVKALRFIGNQSREDVFKMYHQVDVLLFPSKLETWGLPLSEFKQTGKPILVADLPYSHETLGDYDHATYFDPQDHKILATIMEKAINGRNEIVRPETRAPEQPFAPDWQALFDIILAD